MQQNADKLCRSARDHRQPIGIGLGFCPLIEIDAEIRLNIQSNSSQGGHQSAWMVTKQAHINNPR